jgi:uncharacterized surface protein with fasciclin (FAS1) repeats
LWATVQGKNIILTDKKGGSANVRISSVFQSNGVIHVIDTALLTDQTRKDLTLRTQR